MSIGMSVDQRIYLWNASIVFNCHLTQKTEPMAKRLYWGKMENDIMLDVDRFYVEFNRDGTVIRKRFNQEAVRKDTF